jgi:hypothetical protein
MSSEPQSEHGPSIGWLESSLGYVAMVSGAGLIGLYVLFSQIDMATRMERTWLGIGVALFLSGYIGSVCLARLYARIDALQKKLESLCAETARKHDQSLIR